MKRSHEFIAERMGIPLASIDRIYLEVARWNPERDPREMPRQQWLDLLYYITDPSLDRGKFEVAWDEYHAEAAA